MSEVYYFGNPKLKPKDDQAHWYKEGDKEQAGEEKLREKFWLVDIKRTGI